LRTEVDSLHERYQKQVHGLSDILVTAAPSPGRCPVCGIAMKVRKTLQRGGATLAHGSFRVRETVYACPSGCKKQGRIVIARSLDLAKLLLPRSGVGYDLMVQIGLDRFVRHRQREETRADLKSLHGAIMRDLGRAMTEAANEFVRSLKDPIPVLACHQHFLADIGKDLLEDGHTQLRDFVPQCRTAPAAARIRPAAGPPSR
jgi:hypothetical protein